jgi:tetratricopeptide (TPR) repeat protein
MAGNRALAEPGYAQRLAGDSNDVTALHRMALLRAYATRYDESLALLDRAMRLAPGDADIAIDLARVLSWAGRTDSATVILHRMLERNPRDAEALKGLGRARSWSGDLRAGERYWRSALEIEPNDAEALFGLGSTLRGQSRDAAALEYLRRAVELEPNNTDARKQLAEAEAATSPRIAPTYVYETDSDGNRIHTVSFSGGGGPRKHVQPRVDGYIRHLRGTDLGGAERDPTTSAIRLGVGLNSDAGWTANFLAGTTGEISNDAPTTTAAITVASPRWMPFAGSLNYNRAAYDYTAALALRGVRTDQIAADATARLNTRWHVIGNAAATRYKGAESNQQLSGGLASTYRLAPFTLGLAARAFTFEKDRAELVEGYFNPDFYGIIELTTAFVRVTGPWTVSVEAAPGYQQIESDGERSASFRGNGRGMYAIAPGRHIGVSATYANSGLQQLSSTTNPDYRYRAFSVFGSWAF